MMTPERAEFIGKASTLYPSTLALAMAGVDVVEIRLKPGNSKPLIKVSSDPRRALGLNFSLTSKDGGYQRQDWKEVELIWLMDAQND